jgi:nucleoside-diphosphate-sugar epimerase
VSSYLYGNPEYLPIDENHPVKACNPYSHTKLVADEICRYYRDQFSLGISILRPFNAYGPGQSGQFLIPELIRKILDPQIAFIEVMDLRPKRDFVFIDDLVEALYLSMDGPRGIYNVGSGSSVSVEEVINTIKDLTGIRKNVLTRNVERPMEIFDLYADVSKITALLKWKVNVSFKEGLAQCIKEYPATKENS